MGGNVEVPMEFKIQLSYDDGKTWMDLRRYYLPNCSFETTKKTIDLYRKENTRIKCRIVGREIIPWCEIKEEKTNNESSPR